MQTADGDTYKEVTEVLGATLLSRKSPDLKTALSGNQGRSLEDVTGAAGDATDARREDKQKADALPASKSDTIKRSAGSSFGGKSYYRVKQGNVISEVYSPEPLIKKK